MIDQNLKDKVAESRRDGYIVFDVQEGPITLGAALALVKDVFPTLSLDQLAIIQAEDDQVVIAAAIGSQTQSN
jgi:hypothetical protein